MSIAATLTWLLILPVRRIKKLPRRLATLLWLVPLVRMTVPVGLDSPYSLMSLLSKITARSVVVFHPTEHLSFSMMNSVMAAKSYFPITYKTGFLEDIFRVASVVWLVVALAIFLMLAVVYVTTLFDMKGSVRFKDGIYLSEKVASPAVYGILKPRIVLPASYQDREFELIAEHEAAHIRGHDNLWRTIAFLVVAMHWFNPFCWWFLKKFLADLEMSCDERVLAKIGTDRAKEYAASLLESQQETRVFASAFGGAKIRARIENILSFRKLAWFSLAAFVALIGVIFYVLLTNAG